MRSSLRPHCMTQAASVASSSNKRIMQEATPVGIHQIDGHTRRNPGRGGGLRVYCHLPKVSTQTSGGKEASYLSILYPLQAGPSRCHRSNQKWIKCIELSVHISTKFPAVISLRSSADMLFRALFSFTKSVLFSSTHPSWNSIYLLPCLFAFLIHKKQAFKLMAKGTQQLPSFYLLSFLPQHACSMADMAWSCYLDFVHSRDAHEQLARMSLNHRGHYKISVHSVVSVAGTYLLWKIK